jgi:hypothetical protein
MEDDSVLILIVRSTWYKCFRSIVFLITGSIIVGSFDLSIS